MVDKGGDGPAAKPVPDPGEIDGPYWAGAREGRLVVQRCADCGRYNHPPGIICPYCGSEDLAWTATRGRGTIHSFSIARQSTTRGFQEELPYVVVLVALDEDPGALLLTNLVGDPDLEAIDLDDPVAVTFESRGDVVVPQFRLAGDRV